MKKHVLAAAVAVWGVWQAYASEESQDMKKQYTRTLFAQNQKTIQDQAEELHTHDMYAMLGLLHMGALHVTVQWNVVDFLLQTAGHWGWGTSQTANATETLIYREAAICRFWEEPKLTVPTTAPTFLSKVKEDAEKWVGINRSFNVMPEHKEMKSAVPLRRCMLNTLLTQLVGPISTVSWFENDFHVANWYCFLHEELQETVTQLASAARSNEPARDFFFPQSNAYSSTLSILSQAIEKSIDHEISNFYSNPILRQYLILPPKFVPWFKDLCQNYFLHVDYQNILDGRWYGVFHCEHQKRPAVHAHNKTIDNALFQVRRVPIGHGIVQKEVVRVDMNEVESMSRLSPQAYYTALQKLDKITSIEPPSLEQFLKQSHRT